MTETASKLLTRIVADLDSDNETKILEALAKVPEKGNEKVVPSLIRILEKDYSDSITEKVTEILSQLKSTAALSPIMESIPQSSARVRQILLSAVWHSGLDASPYLTVVVKAAVEGSYLECLEAITIVENIDILPSDSQIMESLVILRTYEEKGEDSDKTPFLKDIKAIIQKMEDSL